MMKWSKTLALASLFFSFNAFSYNANLWDDSRKLHNSAWHVVQLIESRSKLSHLTTAIRDFANRAGDLKYTLRTRANSHQIEKDFARVEQAYHYLVSRIHAVSNTSQYKKISVHVEKMKNRYYRLRSDIGSYYGFGRRYYRDHPYYRNHPYYRDQYYYGRDAYYRHYRYSSESKYSSGARKH